VSRRTTLVLLALLGSGPAVAAEERSYENWRLGCALDPTGSVAGCGLKQLPVAVFYTELAGLMLWIGQGGSSEVADIVVQVDGNEPLRWERNGSVERVHRLAIEQMTRGRSVRVAWTEREDGLRWEREVSLDGFVPALSAAIAWVEKHK
jgi:hypothetical protein